MRGLLGLPKSLGDDFGIDGADDIDSVDTLVKLVLRMIDRLDKHNELVRKIARHVGVPLRDEHGGPEGELVKVNGATSWHRQHEKVIAMPEDELAFRGGHEHPALPDGFAR